MYSESLFLLSNTHVLGRLTSVTGFALHYVFRDIFELSRINFCELNGHCGQSCEHPVGPVIESPVYRRSCPIWAAKCHRVGVMAMASVNVVDLWSKDTAD